MLGYPVSTVADIARDPQLAARGFFADVRDPSGGTTRHCGAFALIDGKRPALRHAAGAEIALPDLLAEWSGGEGLRAKRARLGERTQ